MRILDGEQVLVRIFVGEEDRHHRSAEEVVARLQRLREDLQPADPTRSVPRQVFREAKVRPIGEHAAGG